MKTPLLLVLTLALAPLAAGQESPPALFAAASGPETRGIAGRHPGAIRRARPARTRADTLAAVAPGARLRLNLFADVDLDAVVTRDATNAAGDRVLSGRLLDGGDGRFVLVDHGGEVAGDVMVSPSERYAVRHPAGGGAGALEVRAVDPDAEPGCDAGAEAFLPAAVGPKAHAVAPPAQNGPAEDGGEFTVLVGYTPAAVNEAGGVRALEALAALCVENANAAYDASQIATHLRLVGVVPVDYTESGDLYTDTIRLATTDDGYGDDLHAERDAYAADLVSVFEADVGNNSGYGIWTTVRAADGTRVLSATAGFSTVVTTFASPYTFAHEIGHNFGCQHDAENAQGTTLAPYAYGYRWKGSDKTLYRDVMAYAPGQRVGQFSNPNVLYAGVPTGTAEQANTARMMNERRVQVANFRPPYPTPPSFFDGATDVGGGFSYLQTFGYYRVQADPAYIFHNDLGFLYYLDAKDQEGGAYFYDFATTAGGRSLGFFYTSPSLFPYLYSFGLNTFVYYFPDSPRGAGFYTTAPRVFARTDTGEVLFR